MTHILIARPDLLHSQFSSASADEQFRIFNAGMQLIIKTLTGWQAATIPENLVIFCRQAGRQGFSCIFVSS